MKRGAALGLSAWLLTCAAAASVSPAFAEPLARRGNRPLEAPTGRGCATVPPPGHAGSDSAPIPWPRRYLAPERVWPMSTGLGVTVAVIDSGVDASHPQLRGRVKPGADFLETTAPPGTSSSTASPSPNPGRTNPSDTPASGQAPIPSTNPSTSSAVGRSPSTSATPSTPPGHTDCLGHGTAVASIIAAQPTQGTGLIGLAPHAKILPVRVTEQEIIDGRFTGRAAGAAQLAKAIRWAADHDADVINVSLVLYQDAPEIRAAVAYAAQRDIVIVAAAGNLHQEGGVDPTPFPAAYPDVVAVGGVDSTGNRVTTSQTGEFLDLVAPGSQILAAQPQTYGPSSGRTIVHGTSFAAAFVSATVALLRAYAPESDAATIRRRLIDTASVRPNPPATASAAATAPNARANRKPHPEYGYGTVDPYRAIADPTQQVVPRAKGSPLPRPDAAAPAKRRSGLWRGLTLAASGGAITALTVIGAMIAPRGNRRRWQPGTYRK